MSSDRMPLAILAGVLAAGLATWLVLSSTPTATEKDPETPPRVQPQEEPLPAKPAPVEAPPQKVQAPDLGMLLLPNGTKVRPLNNVKNPPRLVWQAPEWSPIVRTEHNNGIDWYVHQDGSYSTTLMMWRSDLGRTDAASYALHPLDAVPVAPIPPAGTVLPGQQPPGRR